ncbi:hypothetical protein GCM10009712_36690 [Pseudarthrobacter sulfonivorans]|uniref:hypothetical protein n=1 Tax=Pseudarthrobacter sulfonivorans TaxID=121292 RepID=UPI00168BA6A0|nr:hypothetical protein [Pseudarthrobacter sulfonivorans]
MKRRLVALSAVPLLLLIAGCGSVQEAAENAANDAASKVATAATDEVRKQVCAVVEDGLVSIQDKALLGGLVSAADAAGVPAEITTPLGEIAEAGDQVPAGSVDALTEACRA